MGSPLASISSLRDGERLRVGSQHLRAVVEIAGGRVVGVTARRRDVDVAVAVVRVVRLAQRRTGAAHRDHVLALARHRDARARVEQVTHLRRLARNTGEVGARCVRDDLRVVGRTVAGCRHERHAVSVGVVERPLHGRDDRSLLRLLGRRVGRVVRAVEQPRIDVVAHVDDVDAVSAGVGQRVDRRLEEEVARVLPGPEVDDRRLRRHARDAEPVDGRGDGRRPRACRGRPRRRWPDRCTSGRARPHTARRSCRRSRRRGCRR